METPASPQKGKKNFRLWLVSDQTPSSFSPSSWRSRDKNGINLYAYEVGADFPELLTPRLVHGLVGDHVFPRRRLGVLPIPPPVGARSGEFVRGHHVRHAPPGLLQRPAKRAENSRKHLNARTGKMWANLPRKRTCLLYTSPSPRDATLSRMPSSA